MLTRGRTKTTVELPLEALIVITDTGIETAGNNRKELRKILKLAREPISVAEISAHLSIPLQTAKILVGDLMTTDSVQSHTLESADRNERPDLQLLERVLDGLQNL